MKRSAAKKMKQRSAGKPDIELGKRIRLRRVEQKISQAELGDKLGVSFQQVQKYEKGVNRVGAARLQTIATALDVPVTFFYDERRQGARSRKPPLPRQRLQPPAAARLQQDQGPDGATSAGVPDGVDRRERGLSPANSFAARTDFAMRPSPQCELRVRIAADDRPAQANRPRTSRRAEAKAVRARQHESAAAENGGIRPADVRDIDRARCGKRHLRHAACHSSLAPEFLTVQAQRSASALT